MSQNSSVTDQITDASKSGKLERLQQKRLAQAQALAQANGPTASNASQATISTNNESSSPMSDVVRSITATSQNTGSFGASYNPVKPTEIPLDSIWFEDVQVRLVHVDNAIENLAESIEKNGLQQAISIRRKINPKNPSQEYCIVAGHTRYKAFKLLRDRTESNKFDRIPAIKVEIDDKNLLELQFAENEERYDLLPIEVARALTALYIENRNENPILDVREYVLGRQKKYPLNYLSMVRIMLNFSIHKELEVLQWFGSLNIKWANIADELLKLFHKLHRAKKITTFADFKILLENERVALGFENFDQKNIKALIAKVKEKHLEVQKMERSKKDTDILTLSTMSDYTNLVSDGSMHALGATVQYAVKDCEKQDIGALLKAIAERIGSDELGEMLFQHLHK